MVFIYVKFMYLKTGQDSLMIPLVSLSEIFKPFASMCN